MSGELRHGPQSLLRRQNPEGEFHTEMTVSDRSQGEGAWGGKLRELKP